MSEKEYIKICEMMKSINEIKNNLLTFSFTSVIAIVGFAFTQEYTSQPIIYLVPFFLIIPFTGRIIYYRTWEARMGAFLEVFSSNIEIYELYSLEVKELHGITGTIISYLVNYEMLFLSFISSLLFYVKYPVHISNFSIFDWLYNTIPITLTIIVFSIIKSAFDFGKMQQNYKQDWENAKNNIRI